MQMRSFKKMTREKKVKVLTLIIFLCLFGWFRKVKAIDVPKLKHFIRDGNNGNLEGVCIASENDVYFATDWTFPLEGRKENQPSTERYFLPNLTSEFNCNFEKNHHCVDEWKSDVWQIPQENDKKYDTIYDYRWEDLPTYVIDKNTPFTDRRIDVHQNISITLSIRSNNGLKISLCEGWLPQKYACYKILFGMINGTDVYVKNSKNETIATYLYQNPIFSFDQWRSFQISFLPTGGISLKDLNDGVEIFNILDKNPLKVIFLFMESDNVSLWKVHENNFLYTNLSTNTTFGPSIKATSKDLTICMLAAMCENCTINFYLKENEEMINLLSTNEINLRNWKLLKIFVKNYMKDQLQLFTETIGPKNGFWMIDNIRICSEKELKVKVLRNSNKSILNMTDNEISCHALSKQQWRPKPYILKFKDVELPSSTNMEFTTSINVSKLNWKPQRIGDEELPFILKYQGHHLCKENYILKNASIERIKSNGIILVEGNQITINELIPYTHYSFSLTHLIYENLTRKYDLNTNELANITENEIPRNIKIIPNVYKVRIIRQPPSCHDIFGRLVYKYSIANQTILSMNEEQDYAPLNSFSNYTLKIETSRNFEENSPKIWTFYNFTTKPDVASAVSYLDAYEIAKKSIGLRYKLPVIVNGVPEKVFVTYCTSLIRNKCDSIVENITKCVQYPDMFCINVKNLIPGQMYKLMLSIRNKGTHTNGTETKLDVLTKPNAPGKISNLTYKVINCSQSVEYCNFNISWSHPWNQLGIITSFEIELIEIDTNKGLSEIYTLSGQYSPTYSHIVHYLPYATTYNISVRAVNNKLKGDYVSIQGKIDHIGEHIDQIPSTENINQDSFLIQIPSLDLRIDNAILTVIVQNDILEHINEEFWEITNGSLCKDVGETWIAKVVEFSRDKKSFTIGDGTSEFSEDYQRDILNKNLLPDNEYCLTYIVHNVYKNKSHTKIYHKLERTLPIALEIEESPNIIQTIMIVLTVFILFILIALGLFRYRHKLNCRRHLQDGEHIYEGIPFDNYSEPDAVYNSTYDQLIHN